MPRPAMIMGTETEYGIYARGDFGDDYDAAVEKANGAILKAVREGAESMGRQLETTKNGRNPMCQHIANGSRFYIDCNHPEMSTPECQTPRDVVIWDSAGESIVQAAAQRATEHLTFGVTIVKKLVDGRGHTWGCHENYSIDPELFYRIVEESPSVAEQRTLATWFTVRQLLIGAGKIGTDDVHRASAFQLSQRADFIVKYRSSGTTADRPMIQVRDEPLGNGELQRRFHVINGDANLCQWSTYLKMGLTGLLLLMWQDKDLQQRPPLPILWEHPYHDVMHFMSRDSDLVARYPVRVIPGRGQLGGIRHLTAAEILTFYTDALAWYAHQRTWSSPAEAAAYHVAAQKAQWAAALLRKREWRALYGWLDWPTKRVVVQEYLRRKGKTWYDVLNDDALYGRVKLLGDHVYATLDPAVSMFARLERAGVIRTVVKGSEIARAVLHPPTGRASQRSAAIEAYPAHIRRTTWDSLTFEQELYTVTLTLDDPMGVADEPFRAVLAENKTPIDLCSALSRNPIPNIIASVEVR